MINSSYFDYTLFMFFFFGVFIEFNIKKNICLVFIVRPYITFLILSVNRTLHNDHKHRTLNNSQHILVVCFIDNSFKI